MGWARHTAKLAFSSFDRLLAPPAGPRLLIYHQVGSRMGRQMEVSVEDFIWQLDWLEANREVVDLESALARWPEPGSERLVVLTFDDGYEDTRQTVFPLLKERGWPLVLYLATEGIGGQGRLDWDQVGEMLSSGLLTLGAHTHSHADLRRLSFEEVRDELETSNRLIERHTGVRPAHFAYPWGYWSAIADQVIREVYESAVLGSAAVRSETHSFDPYLIYRYPVQLSDGRRWFPSRVTGGLTLEESVRRRLRAYQGP